MSDAGRLLAAAGEIARRAATAILAIYDTAFDIEQKADHSPITAADLAAHRLITAALAELTPDWPILSEESAGVAWSERRQWQRYWLVDPLDGTREFVKRNGEFTVNIALVEDGVPVLGVVQIPVTGELYAGARGEGAWRQPSAGAAREPIACVPAATPLRVAGSRSHGSAEQARLLANLGPHTILPLGSAIKFCRVAEGRADLYLRLGPTSEWDTAAGQCVLEAAGGKVTDLAGRPLRCNTQESLLNPSFLAAGDASIDWAARLGEAGS